jgi:ribonuclease P protein subunit RPR2
VKGSTKTTSIRQIARQRIDVLFYEAQQIGRRDPKLAMQYVKSARRIAMAARIRLPTQYRRQFCKNCNALLIYGVNCRVRLQQKREPHVVATCLNCGYKSRVLLKKKSLVKIEQDNYTNETPR